MTQKSKSNFSIKNITKLAKSYLRPEEGDSRALENYLKGWFCVTFNTTLNDQRLLDMTIEELVLMHEIHRLKNNPEALNSDIIEEDRNDYEEWIKEQMGEDYVTEEEMIEQQEKYEKKVKKDYPDKITTDFSQFKKD